MLQTGTPWRMKDTAIPNNAGTTVINQDCLPRHQTLGILWLSPGTPLPSHRPQAFSHLLALFHVSAGFSPTPLLLSPLRSQSGRNMGREVSSDP